MVCSSFFKSFNSLLYSVITFWFVRYSFWSCCLSPCTYSSCSDRRLASYSSSFLSEMYCYNSLLSFSHSFSCNSLLLDNSVFFFLNSFNSVYSRWYLAFSISFYCLIWSYYYLNNSYSLSAATFSSFAKSSSVYSLADSFRSISTWLHTSCNCVRDLFSLTANSFKIFSDILFIIYFKKFFFK